ncbi:TetR/AcrR family transcriptional regulator [Microvirga rosea]|uniref:TetR/AcrR family transcriptional regulator n=1 Tax=Microvirga rosea TaxID=2715425 RepID=UPI001D09C220|nr:TetR/AcrR family transcriptional regulator [Microvirga rosea]MCB8823399.1 TetR/AcrR family transcriptional regulator [Microvirga rosea]
MTERGRPRRFERDVALDKAMRLFWRKGFTATSISDLCEAIGITAPSLYAAFGSKEDLYAEALGHFQTATRSRIWDCVEEKPTAREAFEGFLLASADALPAQGTPGGCMITLSAVAGEGSARLGEMVCQARALGLSALEARLDRAVAEGELPPEIEKTAIARFYLSVQQGMSIQARDGATAEDLRLIARSAMAGWDGLTHKAAPDAGPAR